MASETVTNLTPIELATNVVMGLDPTAPPLPAVSSDLTPVAALEAAVRPAVARPPCVVTFSGGRDSSLVLALAARVARRDGLPAPIPATIRFIDIQSAEETSWQELVLRSLDLKERVSIDLRTDLDFVGPLAGRVLRRHGVLWPLNIYLHESLMRHATGGSLMTGMMGDSVFDAGRWWATNDLLGRRRRPEPRDALRLALRLAPRRVRQRVLGRRLPIPPWLRPAAREAFVEARSRFQANEPRHWDRRIDYLARSRAFRIASESMRVLAADANTTLVQPLTDRTFLASIANAGGKLGIGDRTAIMRAWFSGLLPDRLLARPDKAMFGAAFVGPATLEFVSGWQGNGVDHQVVDAEVLRTSWLAEKFDFRGALLLQAAWLCQQR